MSALEVPGQPPPPVCPLMTQVGLMQSPIAGGPPQVTRMCVTCFKAGDGKTEPGCELWSEKHNMCSLKLIAEGGPSSA